MANDTQKAGPVQLHVVHDLGGGIEKWLGDYSDADGERRNLVLRSFAQGAPAGAGLALYRDARASEPLQAWTFSRPIEGAAETHEEYRAAFESILARHGVDVVVVSSLVGHSLDALASDRPTLVVTHDYFPYCPSINLHFGSTCRACDGDRIAACHDDNPDYNAFPGFTPAERERVRERWMALVSTPRVTLVAPSRSVIDNLRRIDPRFAQVRSEVVPHGDDRPLAGPERAAPARGDRLRILVLGVLSHAKGLRLLQEATARLAEFADVHLLGAGEVGELFRHQPHVHVVARFARAELPDHIASIDPHVGLLASVVEETFNYALSELQSMGVPVAATRRGSFPERIEHGKTGYLFEPEADALVALMRLVDADRYTLAAIRERLRGWRPRSAREMVADYHRLAPVEAPRGAASPSPAPSPGDLERALAAQATTAAGIWKELKSASLQLSLVSEARNRDAAAHAEHRASMEKQAATLEEEVSRRGERIAALEKALAEAGARQQDLAAQLHHAESQLQETLASTSWRFSAPVRVAGRARIRVKLLARCVGAFARDRENLGDNARRLQRAWRSGGLLELKKSLLDFVPPEERKGAWPQYRMSFRNEVRPKIAAAVAAMTAKPRISVIVPTYNTPEPMLRQMLRSVEEQLYPQWELVVADDGSSQPHVARVLNEAAAREPRIRLALSPDNRGVSHASNRALAQATGDFVVLLDHDDVLEEQALFRVAESIAADDPDFIYSDEVLVSAEDGEVLRYALRPAFSLEYLRSHPYIVHLVAFRRSLLQEVGGFDESLAISQDYDLILRVAERARKIVHIPEILYQWRLHGTSSGTKKQDQVMSTSNAILARHLERSGADASVTPGSRFNLFETRYALRPGLRVAVIIPTKNHGELVRQCVESLRATVRDVDYDIIVVDHASTDPGTLGYLASISAQVRIVRHEGPFNFSVINNRAVAAAQGAYTHYLFCNNDIEATEPGWLERMLELAQDPGVGIVGPMLLYPDRVSIQHAGVLVGAYGAAEHYAKRLQFPRDYIEPGYAEMLLVNHEVNAVTAACMLMRRDAFERVGGFDESIAVGFGDVDLCLKAWRLGYRIVFCPHAVLVHHESYTRGTSTTDPHPEDSRKYRSKWRWLLEAGDPYYHPALSLTSSNWSRRQPMPVAFEVRRRVVQRGGVLEPVTFSPMPGSAAA